MLINLSLNLLEENNKYVSVKVVHSRYIANIAKKFNAINLFLRHSQYNIFFSLELIYYILRYNQTSYKKSPLNKRK